ncbi:hypothetical protein PhaeoP66_03259 [Phaeobacter inhibens]|uniref:Uncharacterized protein n=1 Tax=Phaeobacter inhibens TaxID=221822 RepID=A0ABM6RHY7_9RHOB|nr:zinc-finger-containing protein [Phaeobacter inhibens]AUQ96001.1 hypothetical protein PhaeoP66_03259 [Phaeobacter inhibens]
MPSDDIDWLALSRAQYVANWGQQTRRRRGSGRNSDLKNARHEAHLAFDPIWRRGYMTRTQAYQWLAIQMQWPRGDCHMGMMTCDECKRVVQIARKYLKRRT